MGQRIRVALAVGLLFGLPLACGQSSSDDDDDAGSSGEAGDGGRGGKAGGGAVLGGTGTGGAPRGGAGGTAATTGGATTGGTTSAGSGGAAGVVSLPGGGRSFYAGGRGGSSGAGGGTAGSGGMTKGGSGGGAGAAPALGALGASCKKDTDCEDPALVCVTSSDLSDGSGPAGGLCTKACKTGNDCVDYGAFCLELTPSDHYCIQGCTTGSLGSPKCHEREDVACSLVGLRTGGASCTSTSDCPSTSICDPNTRTCGESVTGCVPLCAGNFQCKEGQFCDFTSGLCVSEAPTGLPLGAKCAPPATGAADSCQGFCDTGTDTAHGICEALCTLQSSLVGCGWDGTGKPDHVCLFGTVLSPPGDAVFGDVGICGALCDCNADCLRAGDSCVDESGGDVEAIWNRKGYCRPLDPGETEGDTFASCSPGAGGQAGAGG